MSDWDVTLNGQGYMLVPGGYRTFNETGDTIRYRDARIGRQQLTDFSKGDAADLGAWPAPWPVGSAAVGPGPAAQAVSGTLSSSEPKLAAGDRSHLFVVAGTTVYRWARSVGAAAVNRKTLAAAATGMVRLNDVLYIAHGSAADVSRYDDATNVLTASALGAGVKASLLGTFSRGIVLVNPSFPMNLHIYYGNSLSYLRTWKLDGKILDFTQYGNDMIVATDAGLHLLSGEWYQDTDPPAPPETLRLTSWGTLSGQLQDSDDFAWMTVYQGRLMAWLGKRVVVYEASRNWWQPVGLEGSGTSGAAVVNGWLLITITPHASATTWQLWGYDGSGWWLLDEASGTNTLAYPAADGDGKLVTFRAGSNTFQAYDLDDALTSTSLRGSYKLTTLPLDAGELDRRKQWRRVGVEMSRLDGQAVGDWSIAVEHSSDGGTTWTSAGVATSVTSELATVDEPIAATSTGLLVRVTVTSTSGLPPFVTGIWAEYELLDESVRRRRWQLRVHARAKGINRTGALDPRSGQQIRTALWGAWESAATLTFRDVDYSATVIERSVRIDGIKEEWGKPADQRDLGADSVVELNLVEV